MTVAVKCLADPIGEQMDLNQVDDRPLVGLGSP